MSVQANHTVTIIGSGVRVKGDIAFAGYLRVQGEVLGDILCDSDSSSTTAVHESGSVTGVIKSPHIVVGGRVEGSLFASESIEILDGASVAGDAHYKQIAIHEGGVIEGTLLPSAGASQALPRPERRLPQLTSDGTIKGGLKPAFDRRIHRKLFSGRALVVIVLLLIISAGIFAMRQQRSAPHDTAVGAAMVPGVAVSEAASAPAAPPSPPVPAVTEDVAPPAKEAAAEPAAPVVPAERQPEPAPLSVAPALPAAVGTSATDRFRPETGRVIAVRGMEAEKPADVFFVNTQEHVVLYKKVRGEAGDGTRIELPRGAKKRIPVAEYEIVRVAEGRDLDLFYQGRKLSDGTFQSGDWMSFVPVDGASQQR